MSPKIMLMILLHGFEVAIIGGVAVYCFVLNKADFMDLWFIWGPVLILTPIAQLVVTRLFPSSK